MKEFEKNKDIDADQVPTPKADKKNDAGSGRQATEDYVQGAQAGDPKAKRAVDRAGPQAAQELDEEKKEAGGDEKEQKEGAEGRAEVPEILYGGEDVNVPSLFKIKLQVLGHPSFRHQGRRLKAMKGGSDAYILFYWVVIQHKKLESGTAVSQFRNAIMQRARPERLASAAQWLAQADKDEYTTREIIDYLTARKDKLENVWEKDAVQTDGEGERDLAIGGEYKSWGRVNTKKNGYFPFVDFVKGDTAVSLKVIDPYNPESIDRMKAHMDELSARKPGREVDKEVQDEKQKEKEKEFQAFKLQLDLRVPPGSEEKVKELVEYGKKLDIEVKISAHGDKLMEGKLRPGMRPPRPGEYIERGPHGEELPDAQRVTMEHGDEVLPPTLKPDRTWERVSPPKPELAHPAVQENRRVPTA